MKRQAEIIFEDDDILVLNKPPFFLTVPDRYAPEKPNLTGWLKKKYGHIFIVHRLDKETSGVIVFAKNEEAHRNLSMQFEARTTSKTYQTLLEGVVHQSEGTIDKPIALHHNGKRMVITRDGKPSRTDWRVKEKFSKFTLAEADIKTGRLHQIRIHFESIGYPLAVDRVYGNREAIYASEIKGKRYNKNREGREERPLISRVILHAWRLEFDHPTTNERVSFEAELPKDFSAVLKQLRKWGK